MRVKEYFHNIQCDCCGEIASENWWNNEDDANTVADDSGFITLGDRDYCPNCVTIDDDDNYVTKDGRKYSGETHEEIDNSEYFVMEAVKEENIPTSSRKAIKRALTWQNEPSSYSSKCGRVRNDHQRTQYPV